jgi:hypothetical protein
MPINNREKGRRNELKAKSLLEGMGYAVALTPMPQKFKTEQDFFGLFDIIAIRRKDIRLVQVKTNRKPSVAYRNSLGMFPAPENVTRELWIFKDRQKEPEIYIIELITVENEAFKSSRSEIEVSGYQLRKA